MALRYDTGTLGNVKRTPQGGIRVPAAVSRAGLLRYKNADGSERIEYRPQEELEREDSIQSLRDAPVTNLHHGMVTAANWRRVSVGSVSGEPRLDGDKILSELIIQDDEVIGMVESGDRRQVSAGYKCTIEHTPGVTPNGERYDAIQRNVRYNHIALVPKGRAGAEISLRLDADDNQVIETETREDVKEPKPMEKIEIINGVEYAVGSAAHAAASDQRAIKERQDADASDALKKENEALKAKVAEIPQLVSQRVALVTKAAQFGVEVRQDMSDDDVRRAVIGKAQPNRDLKGKDSAYLSAALDMLEPPEAPETRQDHLYPPTGPGPAPSPGPAPVINRAQAAREAALKSMRSQYVNANARPTGAGS